MKEAVTCVLPLNIRNLVKALGDSPSLGPYPRIGRFDGEYGVRIFRPLHPLDKAVKKSIDLVPPGVVTDSWVIVYCPFTPRR